MKLFVITNTFSLIRKIVRHNFLPENRISTIVEIAAVIIWMVSVLLFYLCLFALFPQIGPWTRDNMVIIIASFFVTDGFTYGFLERNLHHLAQDIENRTLEPILLRPGSFRRFVSFRKSQFSSLIQIPIAVLMLLIFNRTWNWQFIPWFLSLVLGFLIIYLLWYCFDLLAFWFKIGLQVYPVLNELTSMGQFPYVAFLSSPLLALFFPFLAVAAFPAQGLVTQNIPMVLFIQSLLLAGLYCLSRTLEKRGLVWYRA